MEDFQNLKSATRKWVESLVQDLDLACAWHGGMGEIKTLVKKHKAWIVNARNVHGKNVADIAVEKNNFSLLKYAKEIGITCFFKSDYFQKTSLMHAVEHGNHEVVRELICQGMNPFDSTMHGRSSSFRVALKKGNKKILGALLLFCAESGDKYSLQELLDAKADETVVDRNGQTALHKALRKATTTQNKKQKKYLEIAQLLVDYIGRQNDLYKSKCIFVRDNEGRLPLYWAEKIGDKDLIDDCDPLMNKKMATGEYHFLFKGKDSGTLIPGDLHVMFVHDGIIEDRMIAKKFWKPFTPDKENLNKKSTISTLKNLILSQSKFVLKENAKPWPLRYIVGLEQNVLSKVKGIIRLFRSGDATTKFDPLLISGPSGCGKTLLARSIAYERNKRNTELFKPKKKDFINEIIEKISIVTNIRYCTM